jgi:DNA-binding protein YbaB
MFDILSKLGEIKEKANTLKSKVENQQFETKDATAGITITTNGKKDILSITLLPEFERLSLEEKELKLKEILDSALNQSEAFVINELKQLIPPIAGLNIFG